VKEKMSSQMITIGKIVAPFGLKGEVKVYPYSDFLERCYLLKKVLLEGKDFCGFKVIKKAFIHKYLWVVHFEGCENRDDAGALTGMMVKIRSSERVPLPEGTYYYDQIIGLEALTVDGGKLGIVGEILRTGGNDVYVITSGEEEDSRERRKQILIPALKTVVREINLQKGYLVVKLPPGLVD